MTLTIEVAFFLTIIIGILITMLIIERKHSRLQQEHYFWMAAAAELYIFDYDVRRDTMRLSEACAFLLNLPASIPHFSKVIHNEETALNERGLNYLRKAMQDDNEQFTICLKHKNQIKYFRINSHRFCDYGDYKLNRIMGIFADVTDNTIREQKLKQRAQTDQLTGVYNRGAIVQLVTESINTNNDKQQHAFLMLDIDHFKTINDSAGHQAGDTALCGLVLNLRQQSRHTDIIGRMGGDEFCLLLKDIPSIAFLHEYCNRLLKRISQNVHYADDIPVTISIGCTIMTDFDDFESLYARSDKALYQAKRSGRNTYNIDAASLAIS